MRVVGGLGWVGVTGRGGACGDERARTKNRIQNSMGMLRSGIGTKAREHAENKEGKGRTGTRRRCSRLERNRTHPAILEEYWDRVKRRKSAATGGQCMSGQTAIWDLSLFTINSSFPSTFYNSSLSSHPPRRSLTSAHHSVFYSPRTTAACPIPNYRPHVSTHPHPPCPPLPPAHPGSRAQVRAHTHFHLPAYTQRRSSCFHSPCTSTQPRV